MLRGLGEEFLFKLRMRWNIFKLIQPTFVELLLYVMYVGVPWESTEGN